MVAACADWSGHIVVCGLHGEGLRTVEQLHLAGLRVVVVDDHPDPRLVRVVHGWGVPHLEGNSRLPETLTAAGLAGAAALVCTEEDDLHTLETALLARQLRPDARVVVQIRNPAVGRAVAEAGALVLDVARLSAPAIVEACLKTGSHDVTLGDERFVIADFRPRAAGTLRSLYGDLAPIAVVPGDGGEIAVCPGRDRRVGPGDTVTLVGTRRELQAAGLVRVPDGTQPAPSRGRRLVRLVRHAVHSVPHAVDGRLSLVLCALLALLTVSTAVLRLGYHEPDGARMSILDAVYFTIETVGTVGYGDFSFRREPDWLRVYAIFLMMLGAILATVFFALLTNVLVSRRIEESFGRLRLTGLSDHVVVVGLGSIGMAVAEQLLGAGADVVAVEPDEHNRNLAQARALAIPVVTGDATLARTLDAVQLRRARAIAVTTSDDLVNIETALALRDQLGDRWDGVPVVLRLFDHQLGRTIETSFGFGSVRSTAALAAPWFVGAALGLDILTTFYVGSMPMLVGRMQVAPGGGLDGLAMQHLSARTRVVALRRAHGALEHPPRRNTRFAAGDVAYVVGPYQELLSVLRRDSLSPSDVLGEPGQAASPGRAKMAE